MSKGYIVYHYVNHDFEWMNDMFKQKQIPVFDFVSDNRVLVMKKHTELGGMDAGYYIAQVSEMVGGAMGV